MKPIFAEGASGIEVVNIEDRSCLEAAQAIITSYFHEDVDVYAKMPLEQYHAIVVEAQDALNKGDFARRFASGFRAQICRILGSATPLIQTNLYLRATRPLPDPTHQESIGWHRESFYGPDMSNSINMWVPLFNVNPDNIIRYIPDSHLIPDSEIILSQKEDGSVARFSAGHKLGLLYAPKEIVGGVDLSKSKPFALDVGDAVLFAGDLIHGAGVNRSDKIRFSVDFRLIAHESLHTRKHHFASGRDYFEPL